ncbi:MAG: NADH-quinone oxidoreductase subunit J [Nitrososphaerota archaeon]|nr:NADH-quinone oxidoreductase subunit J [Candidatus Calditenuaceae archaeon]MDW8072661.1 NADH-quinone oxidoreductase subunit J [Nitrososphaerota archaeon]
MVLVLEPLELALLVLALAASAIAVETRSLTRSVFGLLVFTVAIGLIFVLLGAIHIGALQIIVYSGGVMALFLLMIMVTARRDET